MMGLTRRQRQCLECIQAYFARTGYMPTLAEIGAELSLSEKSRAHVSYLLDGLEARGYIRRHKGGHRAIELVEGGIKLSPDVELAVRMYADRTRTSVQAAANELLREYLGKAAA